MSHTVRFKAPLTCRYCGSLNPANAIRLYTSSLGQDAADVELVPGGVIELELLDFADGSFALQSPTGDVAAISAFELWGCRACSRMQREPSTTPG